MPLSREMNRAYSTGPWDHMAQKGKFQYLFTTHDQHIIAFKQARYTVLSKYNKFIDRERCIPV